MSLPRSLNAALHRTTGFRMTRETPEQHRAALAAVRRASAKRRRELRTELKKVRRRARLAEARAAHAEEQAAAARQAIRAMRQRKTQTADAPAHFDEKMAATLRQVRPRTMTGSPKLGALILATRYVARHEIPGDVVECGVWRGGSMQAVAYTLLEQGDTSRELHLFDTFEGMPPPSVHDTRSTGGSPMTAAEMLSAADKDSNLWAVADLDDVRRGMEETGYPIERIHYHPGMVEDTTPGEAPETIAILRLDTDWYASTRHELDVLYDRLSPGGVLIIDDYGDWDGARKATDEWLEATGEPILLAPMGSGRIAVKPPR